MLDQDGDDISEADVITLCHKLNEILSGYTSSVIVYAFATILAIIKNRGPAEAHTLIIGYMIGTITRFLSIVQEESPQIDRDIDEEDHA